MKISMPIEFDKLNKICDGCGTYFFAPANKSNKKFCSIDCYHQSKRRIVELTCFICEAKFNKSYRFRDAKTCSRECFSKLNGNIKRTSTNKDCAACGAKFEVNQNSKDNARFCSYSCFLSTRKTRQPPIQLKCECCKKLFEAPFSHGQGRRFCTKSCSTSGKNNPMFGKPGSMTGKSAWNRGKKKENCDSLKIMGEKISQVLKEKFASGHMSNKGEKNPNFGNTADKISPEKKISFSKAAVERVRRGVSGYKTGHLMGVFRGHKTSEDVKFKSSWELLAMLYWEQQDDIASYSYEPLIVQIDETRRAVPDFLLEYSDGTKEVCEIKPTAMQNISQNRDKLLLTKYALKDLGYTYQLIGDDDILQMKKSVGKKFYDIIETYKGGKQAVSDSLAR